MNHNSDPEVELDSMYSRPLTKRKITWPAITKFSDCLRITFSILSPVGIYYGIHTHSIFGVIACSVLLGQMTILLPEVYFKWSVKRFIKERPLKGILNEIIAEHVVYKTWIVDNPFRVTSFGPPQQEILDMYRRSNDISRHDLAIALALQDVLEMKDDRNPPSELSEVYRWQNVGYNRALRDMRQVASSRLEGKW